MPSYKARIYLSMVDPSDDGHRGVDVDTNDGKPLSVAYTVPIEARDRLTETCPRCGKEHDILWVVKRRPAGVFGHFPIFKINRTKVIVDASLPTGVISLPEDAVRVPLDKAAALWHDTSGLHEFGATMEDEV